MSEPRRLRELHQDDVFGAALRAADRDAPKVGAEEKLLAALGATASVAGATAAAGGSGLAAKVSSSAIVAKWIVGSIVVVSGSIGVMAVVASTNATHESQNHGAVRPAASHTIPPRTFGGEPAAGATPGASSEDGGVAPPRSTSTDVAQRTKPKASPEAKSGPTLEANPPMKTEASSIGPELKEIERARALLASDRASEALDVVNAYQRAFPGGALGQEAVAIRLDALVRLGQRSLAEEEAREFLARHPESPQAPRIRALLRR